MIGSCAVSCLAGPCAKPAKTKRPAAARARPPAKNDLRLFVISLANHFEHALSQLLHIARNSSRAREQHGGEQQRDYWSRIERLMQAYRAEPRRNQLRVGNDHSGFGRRAQSEVVAQHSDDLRPEGAA